MSNQTVSNQTVSNQTVSNRTVPPTGSKAALHVGKPEWLKTKIPTGGTYFAIKRDLRKRDLFTVCEEAKCPNIGTCWNQGTATFMILGDTCTRACRFCNVKTGNPNGWLDPEEAQQTAESARLMQLDYAVITMVDRDDLADGGAAQVSSVISRVKEVNQGIKVEVLTGDFQGRSSCLETVLESSPEVFAHNLETIERLTPRVRDARAGYRQSLGVLAKAKELANYPVLTKTALMLGLGETVAEVESCLIEIKDHGVDIVTLGQYMRPTKKHLSIKQWVAPEVFKDLEQVALNLGFRAVVAGPLVRSSYRAGHYYQKAIGQDSK